jgi:hypothetical protein
MLLILLDYYIVIIIMIHIIYAMLARAMIRRIYLS